MKISRKTLVIAGIPVISLLLIIIVVIAVSVSNRGGDTALEFNTFSSCTDLAARLNQNSDRYYYGDDILVDVLRAPVANEATDVAGGESGSNYSETNVQVAGIDEADIIKTDGSYIYAISNKKLHIIDVREPETALSKIDVAVNDRPSGLFLNDDKLVLITDGENYYPYPYAESAPSFWAPRRSEMTVLVYDINDKENPTLERTVAFDGSYQTARMKDSHVYVVSQYYPNYYGDISAREAEALLPRIADVKGEKVVESDYKQMSDCTRTSYYGDSGNNFSTVVGIDINEQGSRAQKVLVGGAETVYMSQNNLFLTSTDYDYGYEAPPTRPQCDPIHILTGLCPDPDVLPPQEYTEPEVTTGIFKIGIDKLDMEFKAAGSVPGTILNQFSLDESSGYLRIATTVNTFSGWNDDSKNNVYILNEDLDIVGTLENLAPGERIFSTRFLGERLYMVTFKTIDPLFVIDLSRPSDPKVLGELKIPGFSDYLHPYDENHIIGFGKDAEEISDTAAIQQGLKLALFNVSDPANPTEVSSVVIGGRGSDSEVLNDHKALLFDRDKELLVIPATLTEENDSIDLFRYTEREFDGFLVFNIDLEDGIKEAARIDSTSPLSYYSYYGYNKRALYIEDDLFTWDGSGLVVSSLNDFAKLAELEIN